MTGRPQEPDEDYAPSESVTSSSAYITDPGEEDSDCDGTKRGTKRKASQQEVELKPCQSCGENGELVPVGTGKNAKWWCRACSHFLCAPDCGCNGADHGQGVAAAGA